MSIASFFNLILYQPLLNVLILLYIYLPGRDFGIAVIVLTLIIKIVLFPASIKAIRSQKALSQIQPKIKQIQEQYKDNKQKQSQMMMELYKKEKINPLSGCSPLLFQLPILIALYQVFLKGLQTEALKSSLYQFVPFPETISFSFLGILDLNQPSFILALIAGALQFIQTKLSTKQVKDSSSKQKDLKKMDFSGMMQNQMLYFFPLITVFFVWKLGSIIGLYWTASTLFSICEHYLVKARAKKHPG